jgi:hypothetical protein
MLLDFKHRGLSVAPQDAVADGALGFWKALGRQRPQQAAEAPARQM